MSAFNRFHHTANINFVSIASETEDVEMIEYDNPSCAKDLLPITNKENKYLARIEMTNKQLMNDEDVHIVGDTFGDFYSPPSPKPDKKKETPLDKICPNCELKFNNSERAPIKTDCKHEICLKCFWPKILDDFVCARCVSEKEKKKLDSYQKWKHFHQPASHRQLSVISEILLL
ncbi:hypothetical protein SNEBB_007517 [Seison nebaliae]|nr:hypothetical protein SNEBB_007517 [Seison nebaliae]